MFGYHIVMQKFLDKIICGDCIEVFGKVSEPFAGQFAVKTNNDKRYDVQEIVSAAIESVKNEPT